MTKIEFAELTERKYKSGMMCNPKRAELCLILFVDSRSDSLLEEMKPVIEAHQTDPVQFAFIVKAEQPDIFREQFGQNSAVIYRAKRSKYLPVQFKNWQDLSSVLADALSGSGNWRKVDNSLLFI